MPFSNSVKPRSLSCLGGTLISRLNWPSSVSKSGSAIASRASVFFSAGSPTRRRGSSSISSPVIGTSASKRDSRSIRANTSRQRRTFSRYRVRSSRVNSCCATSSPMAETLGASPTRGDRRSPRATGEQLPRVGATPTAAPPRQRLAEQARQPVAGWRLLGEVDRAPASAPLPVSQAAKPSRAAGAAQSCGGVRADRVAPEVDVRAALPWSSPPRPRRAPRPTRPAP